MTRIFLAYFFLCLLYSFKKSLPLETQAAPFESHSCRGGRLAVPPRPGVQT